MPVSGIVNNEELNPFETFTILKKGDNSNLPIYYHKGSTDSSVYTYAED